MWVYHTIYIHNIIFLFLFFISHILLYHVRELAKRHTLFLLTILLLQDSTNLNFTQWTPCPFWQICTLAPNRIDWVKIGHFHSTFTTSLRCFQLRGIQIKRWNQHYLLTGIQRWRNTLKSVHVYGMWVFWYLFICRTTIYTQKISGFMDLLAK